MNIQVSITLGPDDEPPGLTPEDVISALGGDAAKDTCHMSVSASSSPPMPPPPAPEQLPVMPQEE